MMETKRPCQSIVHTFIFTGIIKKNVIKKELHYSVMLLITYVKIYLATERYIIILTNAVMVTNMIKNNKLQHV